jgi:hypothetical protein
VTPAAAEVATVVDRSRSAAIQAITGLIERMAAGNHSWGLQEDAG